MAWLSLPPILGGGVLSVPSLLTGGVLNLPPILGGEQLTVPPISSVGSSILNAMSPILNGGVVGLPPILGGGELTVPSILTGGVLDLPASLGGGVLGLPSIVTGGLLSLAAEEAQQAADEDRRHRQLPTAETRGQGQHTTGDDRRDEPTSELHLHRRWDTTPVAGLRILEHVTLADLRQRHLFYRMFRTQCSPGSPW